VREIKFDSVVKALELNVGAERRMYAAPQGLIQAVKKVLSFIDSKNMTRYKKYSKKGGKAKPDGLVATSRSRLVFREIIARNVAARELLGTFKQDCEVDQSQCYFGRRSSSTYQ
jgi:hypothetical protein